MSDLVVVEVTGATVVVQEASPADIVEVVAQGPQGAQGAAGAQGPKGDTGDVTPEALAAKVAAEAAATSATASATSATSSATAAASSATAASNSANSASGSATQAANSATSASGSATTATTKASEASTSATNAASSASSASTSASNASTSETNAASSATSASNSASSASTSASNASASATTATTKAGEAASSATAAASAQAAAESARDSALAAFDSFDDRYLGVKASDPTLDNDGNALVAGALYYNSAPLGSGGGMKVYDASTSTWLAAYASLSGALLVANNLSDLGNAATARTNLGLGNVENKSSATIRGEISSSNVTTALGFTPYDASNPSGFITVSALSGYLTSSAAASTYLALSGGTLTGNLTGPSFSGGYFDIDTAATPSLVAGRMYWNAARGVPTFGLAGGNVSLELGEGMQRVHNAEATSLVDGDVVYLFGAHGDLPSVKKASNVSEATSSKIFGVITETIAANGSGFCTTEGIVNGLNTSAYAEGTALWLGATAGTYTSTKPVAPAHLVFVGVVTRANAGNGAIFVKPQNGYELNEIHDVLITSAATNDFFVRAADGLWKNRALASADVTAALGFTPYDAANPAGYITSSALSGYMTSSAASSTYLALAGGTLTGDLTFSGSARRITGDLSNATHASRLLFQTTTANATTSLGVIPNGTGTISRLFLYNNSDPTNASYFHIGMVTDEARIWVGANGSGTNYPLVFQVGGSEAIRVATTKNFLIGTSVDNATDKLQVNGTIKSLSGGFVFPDGTTQTTAATAGVSTGKAIAMAIVFGA